MEMKEIFLPQSSLILNWKILFCAYCECVVLVLEMEWET